MASLGGGGPPRVTPSRGDTRIKLFFLWLNLKRTLDKRCEKTGVVRRRQLKKVITVQRAKKVVIFSRKNRVTPTLVTPLHIRCTAFGAYTTAASHRRSQGMQWVQVHPRTRTDFRRNLGGKSQVHTARARVHPQRARTWRMQVANLGW